MSGLPHPDIWQMALLMDERYGADAILESVSVAEHLLEDGDSQGGHTYAAPELDFGSLQYALLGLGGVSAFLFGRRGRR